LTTTYICNVEEQQLLFLALLHDVSTLIKSKRGLLICNPYSSKIIGLNRLINDENIDPNTTLALINFQNAFCEVKRQWFFDEVYRLFPQISPWVKYIYGCSALMFTGDDICYSNIGVQQGDPLGPLLFA
jgi:hypothetical protein